MTTEGFIKKAETIHGKLYTYTKVQYIKSHSKVIITCGIHGEFLQRPNDHLQGYGCPHCGTERTAMTKRSSADNFIKKAQEVHGNVYDYSDIIYTNAITKVCIKCSIHGAFYQTPDKHINSGTACPQCSYGISKGEKVIKKFLDANNITYEREKRFKDLKSDITKKQLRFDFFLEDYNLIIEYDGAHHFSPINVKGKLGDVDSVNRHHQRILYNDAIKNNYIEQKGFNILRINYKDNITEVLMSYFQLALV